MRSYIAADLHAESITYAVFYGSQVVEQPKRIPNTVEALDRLAKTYPGFLVLVEACGYHEFVSDTLTARGMSVKAFVAPRRERHERKNDRKDALRLGKRFGANDLREVWIPSVEIRGLRRLIQTRVRLAQQSASEQARVQLTLHHAGYWKRHVGLEHKPFRDANRELVLAENPLLDASYGTIDLVEKHVRALDRRIEQEGSKLWPVRRMRTIPGFGPQVSLAYYAHVGDVRRFPSADHVVSFLGLDPMWEQSGERLRDLHKISHAGPAEVRMLLDQAAWAHTNFAKDSDLARTYHRKAETMGKAKAVTALMADLAKAAYAVWRDDRDFTMKRPPRFAPCRTPTAPIGA